MIYNSGIPIGTRPYSHTPNIMGTNEEPWMSRDSIDFIYPIISNMKSKNLKDLVLQEAKNEWENFNTIIGKPISINKVKLIKVLKY